MSRSAPTDQPVAMPALQHLPTDGSMLIERVRPDWERVWINRAWVSRDQHMDETRLVDIPTPYVDKFPNVPIDKRVAVTLVTIVGEQHVKHIVLPETWDEAERAAPFVDPSQRPDLLEAAAVTIIDEADGDLSPTDRQNLKIIGFSVTARRSLRA